MDPEEGYLNRSFDGGIIASFADMMAGGELENTADGKPSTLFPRPDDGTIFKGKDEADGSWSIRNSGPSRKTRT